MKVREIYDYLNSIAPYDTQCQWDNSGLAAGSPEMSVSGIMTALDCTNSIIEQAKEKNCSLIVTHHPLIFSSLKTVEKDTPVYNAVKNDIAVLSAHTNYDMAQGGVNDVLGELLELENIGVLYGEGLPIMRAGEKYFKNAGQLAEYLTKVLKGPVKYTDGGGEIKKIGLCGGSGGEYAAEALNQGCDAFITGEAKHHEFLEAQRLGISLFAAGHYHTENPAAEALYKRLKNAFPDCPVYLGKQASPYKTALVPAAEEF